MASSDTDQPHRAVAGPAAGPRRQVAALCWRAHGGRVEVLLVTSRDTGRWVVPKGWPIPGLTPAAAAAREAFEEAGVRGEVATRSIGTFRYLKRLADGTLVPCDVALFPLAVRRLADDFPERGQRVRKWMTRQKAAARVAETELARLIAGFEPPGPGDAPSCRADAAS